MNRSVFYSRKNPLERQWYGSHVTGRRPFVSDAKRSARESGQGTLAEERSVREANVHVMIIIVNIGSNVFTKEKLREQLPEVCRA